MTQMNEGYNPLAAEAQAQREKDIAAFADACSSVQMVTLQEGPALLIDGIIIEIRSREPDLHVRAIVKALRGGSAGGSGVSADRPSPIDNGAMNVVVEQFMSDAGAPRLITSGGTGAAAKHPLTGADTSSNSAGWEYHTLKLTCHCHVCTQARTTATSYQLMNNC